MLCKQASSTACRKLNSNRIPTIGQIIKLDTVIEAEYEVEEVLAGPATLDYEALHCGLFLAASREGPILTRKIISSLSEESPLSDQESGL